MKYVIYALFIVVTSAIAMDDTGFYNQLQHLICNGSLADFQLLEPCFRANLDENTILTAQQLWCRPGLTALADVQTIEANPVLKRLILTMQQEIESVQSSNQQAELIEKYKMTGTPNEKVASDIIWHIRMASISPFGRSIKNIMAVLEQKADPKQYLVAEQAKLTYITTSLQQILDDEFEPGTGLEYDQEYDVFFMRRRERKQQNH